MKHAIAILALGVLAGCGDSAAPVETDREYMERIARSRVFTWTDPELNCDYLITKTGGITPRLNPDGTQVCTQKDNGND